jgi:hypothetical protein
MVAAMTTTRMKTQSVAASSGEFASPDSISLQTNAIVVVGPCEQRTIDEICERREHAPRGAEDENK